MKFTTRPHALTTSILALLVLVVRPVSADQVIAENLIINGNAAIGFDAINNEVFGDDSIRLKENNLRIAFFDSNGNDWRIVANDQASGGASYLGFEDITGAAIPLRVMAGATGDSLRIDDFGNVGLATGSPGARLHVNVGFDAMTPEESVLIGPEAVVPSGALLEVRGPIYISGSANPNLTVDASGDARLFVEGSAIFSKNFEIASSRGFKEEIREVSGDEALQTLRDLEAVEYRYKGDSEVQLGFIAEDVPALVATDSRRSLSPMDVVAILSTVVQEREAKIRERELQIEEMRRALEEVRRRRGDVTPIESPQPLSPER
jgi:hypothetical protein